VKTQPKDVADHHDDELTFGEVSRRLLLRRGLLDRR
jgi:hypothetical protein